MSICNCIAIRPAVIFRTALPLNTITYNNPQRDVTVNTFVSQILKRHMEGHLNQLELDFCMLWLGCKTAREIQRRDKDVIRYGMVE